MSLPLSLPLSSPLLRLPEEEQQHVGQIRATGRLRARVFFSCQFRTVQVAVDVGAAVVAVAVPVAVAKLIPVEKNVKYQLRKINHVNMMESRPIKSLVLSRYLSHAAAPLGALSNTRMRTRARIACPQYWYAPRPRPRSARAASASTSFDRLRENE